MKRLLVSVFIATLSFAAVAQSENFKLGESLDIQNSILQILSKEYVDTVKFDKIILKGVDAMLAELDPYTMYFPEEQEEDVEMMTTGIYGGVGSLIKKKVGEGVLIVEPYFNSPAVKAGLQPGDTILAIDGESVLDVTSEKSSSKMKGTPGTVVNFKVRKVRSGQITDVNVTRERVHISNINYSGIIRDSIGYVEITGFTDKMSQELKEAVINLKKDGAKRLVLDLRGNGGGLMEEAIKMVSLFVPKGTLVVSSRGRVSDINKEYFTTEEPIDTIIPIMVMVNNASASSSEIVAGALQDLDRAVIGGVRSFGKGLIQSIRPTSFNGSVKITTGKYYTPSGRCVQAIDYSHRNEDGSVGSVPDSLIREFKTRNGRVVKDGGGITPDIISENVRYSRPAVSLIYNDILGDYAIKYYAAHPEIASAQDFVLTDEEYEDFVKYADTREFDFRSGMKAQMDELVKAARYDGMYDDCKEQIEALAKSVDIDKATMLRNKKDEIKPLLEAEIVVKYYFNSASTIIALRNDTQLYQVIEEWK